MQSARLRAARDVKGPSPCPARMDAAAALLSRMNEAAESER